MSVEELLQRYIAEFRSAGRADPAGYLDQLSGADRAELAALIDGFLAAAPPPAFDAAAFAAFSAEPARQAMVEDLLAPGSLLEYRQRAGLSRDQVAARLASELSLAGREGASAVVFHEIEAGLVEPRRVRPRVWEALAALYAEGADRLRRAAEAAFEGRGPAGGRVYARSAAAPPVAAPAAAPPPPASPGVPDPDEAAVRRAFLEDG